MAHETHLRVRFGETDLAGHVNNAVYLTYLEESRMQFLRDVLAINDVPLILAAAHLDFVSQVLFPEELILETVVTRFGRSSFDLDTTIVHAATHQVALKAKVTLVYFNYTTQASEPLPDVWRERLKAYVLDAPVSQATGP